MSVGKQRCFEDLDEAKSMIVNVEKEAVFHVKDPQANREIFVLERSHPLARSAAALYWGVTAEIVESGPRKVPTQAERAASAVSKLTDEERAALLASLNA